MRRPRATVTSRSSSTSGAALQDITIKLDREHVIRGRLIDTQGQPAAGVTVRPIMVIEHGDDSGDPDAECPDAALRVSPAPRDNHRRQGAIPHSGHG